IIIVNDTYNLNANKTVALDKSRVNHFVYNGKKIVSVVEPENPKAMNVTFDNVGVDASGKVSGFIVMTSAVGKSGPGDKQEPGHLFFEVKQTLVNTNRPPEPPGNIKITME